jgi:hypothetical protein
LNVEEDLFDPFLVREDDKVFISAKELSRKRDPFCLGLFLLETDNIFDALSDIELGNLLCKLASL